MSDVCLIFFLSSQLNQLKLNAVLVVDTLRELRARTVVGGVDFLAAAHVR